MSSTSNKAAEPLDYAPLEEAGVEDKVPYNTRQRVAKLVRQIRHKNNYGVATMAQQRIKVNELQDELVGLGFPRVELIKPDFDDPAMLQHYAELSNYKG
jgi:hypothetical protein